MSYLSAASETIGVIKTAVCACENYRGIATATANRRGTMGFFLSLTNRRVLLRQP